MSSHSTVKYVEPNASLGIDDWRVNDDFDRAPRLEDYCIAMNIEVEISSRDSVASQENSTKDVIIMQWDNSNKNTKESISFLSGTKIGGYDINGTNRKARIDGAQQNLTTYYADMYVGDLIDYGTTEMIGIKSVDIQYEKSCVPIITIQFTDVRGLSLFQPTELSRNNSYEGIKGLNKDNIAQSFFQCFFKMPYPKFTIYLKGFYGEPVAYVVMCDKFDTNFNSETGDFDVTVRFIGYSYSFLTDVSFDALMAAPYCEYYGKEYWDENVRNGNFFLYNKFHDKVEMPTLSEVHNRFKDLLLTSNKEMEETTVEGEENSHEDEIRILKNIKDKYELWYTNLFNLLRQKYGKRYVYEFKENVKDDPNWKRIIILANSTSISDTNLSKEYLQFSDDFKKINDDLYALVEDYNNSSSGFKKLNNVSKDFSTYTRIKLFKECYVNKNTRKIEFGGFNREYNGNKTEIVNRLFHSEGAEGKDYVLSTIYGDGDNQYIDAYLIEVDYSEIKRRLNVLSVYASKSQEDKDKEKKRKEYNRIMMGKMNWYPSVENFTRIMMAHLETFMAMMYKVAEDCATRTPEELGITIGKEGIACDVNGNSNHVPPFPRVTKNEVGDDGITKTVDAWVGEWKNGKGFVEVDLINSLFNAVDKLDHENKEKNEMLAALNANESSTLVKVLKHPLTSYDFFLTSNPWGYGDVSNDPNAFAGKVAIRMFDVLRLSNFSKEFSSKFSKGGDFIKKLGEIDAENFFDKNKITNRKLLQLLGVGEDSGTITQSAIMDCVKSGIGIGGDNNIPWKESDNDDNLFEVDLSLSKYVTSYNTSKNKNKQITRIYPIQNVSFDKMNETLKYFNKGVNSVQYNNNNIVVNWIDGDAHAFSLFDSKNKSGFGNLYITDDFKGVSNMIENGNTEPDNSYKEIYDLLRDRITFNGDNFKSTIYKSGVFLPKKNIDTKKLNTWKRVGEGEYKLFYEKGDYYSFDESQISSYINDVENESITSWFLSECRGVVKNKNGFRLSRMKSLFEQDDLSSLIDSTVWGYGNEEKLFGFFLMSLEAIDYDNVKNILDCDNTFAHIPKLAVLQMGAALASLTTLDDDKPISIEEWKNKLPLPSSFDKIIGYLNKTSQLTKIAYIKYFREWVNKNKAEISKNLINKKLNNASVITQGDYTRALFREDSDFTSFLTNELMKCVCVVKGNVNHFDNYAVWKVDETMALNYLEGFLKKLRELHGSNTESGGDSVRLVKEPTKTSDDMKKELYRYLKLLYDKWIPSYTKGTWNYQTFFEKDKDSNIVEEGGGGHKFHFIDSFYNKIGNKLLINPSKLSAKIDAAMDSTDVNTMMYGFMADIFAQNKCMILCLQNFIDLGQNKNNGMDKMFKPIPYNEMTKPNKHPDFVVLYPYEPSKHLNIDNAEYNDDSFMLNDEFDTPLPIKSRGSDESAFYNIPAFGVSYGKQYQSYFKKINVGTLNSVATQQSIMAKHAILRKTDNDKSKVTVAQDLYDIYTTQSYTCTVEMMGCAWVQPLMYFVLTNVPMFRGSYLIFKVTHRITPGDMTTTFQGTRMPRTANKLIEDIFTDEDAEEGLTLYEEEAKYKMANVDNDCPYKIYPLYDSNIEISKNEYENANNAMKVLIGQYNFTPIAAAGICGNIFRESSWNLWKANKNSGAFGLCQWLDYKNKKTGEESLRKSNLIKKYGDYPSFDKQLEYIDYEWKEGDAKASKNRDKLMAAKTPTDSATIVCQEFERPERAEYSNGGIGIRQTKAEEYFSNYKKTSSTTTTTTSSEPNQSDIYEAFFNAVNKTAQYTPSIGVSLTNGGNAMNTVLNRNAEHKILVIKQANGQNDKLPKIFDAILNSEYYNYVQVLAWIYSSDTKGSPERLQLILADKPKVENKRVLVVNSVNNGLMKTNNGLNTLTTSNRFGSNASAVNENLLKSIAKKFGKKVTKEAPQFDNMEIFKDIEIENCNYGNGDYPSLGNNSNWAKKVQTMGKWYEKNVHTYQEHIQTLIPCDLLGGSGVRDDCSGLVSACLQYFGAFKKGYAVSSNAFLNDTNVMEKLVNNGFKKIPYSWDSVQPYDIMAYNGHVEILALKDNKPKSWAWGDVHDGLDNRSGMPSLTGPKPKGNTYKIIWRYIG